MYQRIVVPLDGSELAECALTEAEELARVTGAPLHLVLVLDPTEHGLLHRDLSQEVEVQGFRSWLEDERIAARNYLERIEWRVGEMLDDRRQTAVQLPIEG